MSGTPQMRRRLTPEDLRRAAVATNARNMKPVAGSSLVVPAGAQLSRDGLMEGRWEVIDPQVTCPFSAKPVQFLLFKGSVRARGLGWLSAPVLRDALPDLVARCKQRVDRSEKVPATVYLRHDPFSGEALEPVAAANNNGYEYRGAFWVSQLFRSAENARHWFSIRGGRAPVFGPDVVAAIAADMEKAEDDGEAVRREDQQGMDEAMEDADDRSKDRRKTIVSQPGLPPGDSRMPGAE